ncbi:polysaccharide biosynthesis tyrosine autokinase [Bradyrhizobium sp. McL0615]|uniref:polysaccharide biosynthesis tyrosine autokinase n=1 Tax=Bradyrhizobium sp. McL0615 TaxID=3415673 RepID=UPI003CF0D85C
MSEFNPLPQPATAPASLGQRFDYLRGFVQRQYLPIILGLVIVLPIGAINALSSPKTYTASSTMTIESRKGPLDEPGRAAPLDMAWFETNLQNLRSVNVLGYVVKQLNLANDPEFLRSDKGPLDRLLSRSAAAKSDAERTNLAVALLANGIRAQRIGQSYMIRIDFSGRDPELATKIANEMVNAYIADQLNAKYQASRSAGDWLQERLQNLRDQAATAERAVVQFKAKNNIVSAGGTLVSEQQLSDTSAALGKARAQVANLQARLERMDAVRQSYQQDSRDQPGLPVGENFSEAMNNRIIGSLREKYLDLTNREATWSARYGADHVSVQNIRNQIRDMRRSIADELGRIEETAKGELEIAQKGQRELETTLAGALSKTQDANQAQVTLFSLEAAAKSYRSLYDSFLKQHTEAVQRQTYPISDARLISSASVTQTGPQTLKLWLTTLFAGGMLGVGFGALRELLDSSFRTREQIRSVLNTECLALIPRVGQNPNAPKLSYRGVLQMARGPKALPAPSAPTGALKNDHRGRSRMLWNAIDAPNSAYADAIRSVKLSLDSGPDGGCQVIGLTSHMPGEGKSTIAAGVASQLAATGRRVMLIDCDVRNPSLSRALFPDAKLGLLDVAVGEANLAQVMWRDPATNLTFLPMVPNPSVRNPTEALASRNVKLLIESLKNYCDFIIVDMAPLISTVDVLAVSRFVESYMFVVEWGSTKMDAVRHALGNAPAVQMKMRGAVLNKVDFAGLASYEPYGEYKYYGQSSSPPRRSSSSRAH